MKPHPETTRFQRLINLKNVCDQQEISYDFSRTDMDWLFNLAQKEINKTLTKLDWVYVLVMLLITTVLTVGTINAILNGLKL